MKHLEKNILKIKTLTVLMILGVSMSSCSEDYLDLDPTGSVSNETAFSTYSNAEAALVGAYDNLSFPAAEGLYIPIAGDLIGEDIMLNSVDNWGWFVEVYQLDVLANYTWAHQPWNTGYKVIYDANNIISRANTIPGITEEEVNNLVGQAKVLRAFMMLKLVEMYAPSYLSDSEAPSIMNVTMVLAHDDEDLGRAPLSEVYQTIISDLESAKEMLEETDFPGFFDKNAAQAILARAYLNMGEWEKARDNAKLAYETKVLVDGAQLLSGFNTSNDETIFSVAYTSDDNNIYLSLPSFYWPVSGYSSVRIDRPFFEEFATSDFRYNWFLKQNNIDPDNLLMLKFGHIEKIGNAEKISIRAAEMYLIEAECEVALFNYTEAQNALFEVQKRANPIAAKSTNTGDALLQEVLLERRKELVGEGFRWNDIKRRNLPFKREGDHWVKFDFTASDADYYRLTYPIPQMEIDVNTNIGPEDQNIGY